MRIFLTKGVMRFARRERIADASLNDAIERAERGTVDADLGGGLIKQRVARPCQGRSGGFRMIVAYRSGRRAVFLYAFAKNERDNISDDELAALRIIGANWLAASAELVGKAIEKGDLKEIENADNEV